LIQKITKILDCDCKTFSNSSWLISWRHVCIFFNFFVFLTTLFNFSLKLEKFFFQLFVDVFTQNTPPYHRPCVEDLFFTYPLVDLEFYSGSNPGINHSLFKSIREAQLHKKKHSTELKKKLCYVRKRILLKINEKITF